jgi:hypothetical protein
MISHSTSLTITHTIKHDQHFIILVCKASYGKVNNIIKHYTKKNVILQYSTENTLSHIKILISKR